MKMNLDVKRKRMSLAFGVKAGSPPVLQLVPDKSTAGFTGEYAGHRTKAQSKGPDGRVKACTLYGGIEVLETRGTGAARVKHLRTRPHAEYMEQQFKVGHDFI